MAKRRKSISRLGIVESRQLLSGGGGGGGDDDDNYRRRPVNLVHELAEGRMHPNNSKAHLEVD